MATKVTVGKLNVSVTEAVTVNGVDHFYNSVYSVAGINATFHRIIRVPTAAQTALLEFDAGTGTTVTTPSAGSFVPGEIKYLRVTNLDDTNFVTLRLRDRSADTVYLKLSAGQTMTFYGVEIEVSASAAAWSAWATSDDLSAQANTAAVDVEIFAASIAA